MALKCSSADGGTTSIGSVPSRRERMTIVYRDDTTGIHHFVDKKGTLAYLKVDTPNGIVIGPTSRQKPPQGGLWYAQYLFLIEWHDGGMVDGCDGIVLHGSFQRFVSKEELDLYTDAYH